MEYWKNLVEKYASVLKDSGSEEAINYQLISNNIPTAVDTLIEREEYEDAKLLKILFDSHIFKDATANYKTTSPVPDPKLSAMSATTEKMSKEGTNTLKEISHREARQLFNDGEVVLAACAELGTNSYVEAVSMLIRGNELFLALAVSKLLKSPCIDEIYQLLGMRAERLELKQYAEKCYSNCRNKKLLQLFAARNGADYSKLGMKTKEEYEELAKKAVNISDAVFNYILAGKSMEAAKIGSERIQSMIEEVTFYY